MFYLSPEDWSPRFDSSFYTVKVLSVAGSHRIFASWPPSESVGNSFDEDHGTQLEAAAAAAAAAAPPAKDSIKGRANHPAVYYALEVRCGHRRRLVYRRYSQFRWLCDRALSMPPPPSSDPLEAQAEQKRGRLDRHLPPKTMTVVPNRFSCLIGDDWKDEDFIEQREEALGTFLGKFPS